MSRANELTREAEAVAFVVGGAVGLDTSDSSRDYIHLYRGDREALARSLDRVQDAASVILGLSTPPARKPLGNTHSRIRVRAIR